MRQGTYCDRSRADPGIVVHILYGDHAAVDFPSARTYLKAQINFYPGTCHKARNTNESPHKPALYDQTVHERKTFGCRVHPRNSLRALQDPKPGTPGPKPLRLSHVRCSESTGREGPVTTSATEGASAGKIRLLCRWSCFHEQRDVLFRGTNLENYQSFDDPALLTLLPYQLWRVLVLHLVNQTEDLRSCRVRAPRAPILPLHESTRMPCLT